ncbi:MAG: arsenate reductase (glutaredoxin) [Micavibrio sp.]|jgi:arsenate reductase|nr:MAG: arsenate reductase (glutaredoxin) [Micavibrio sp.]
MTIKIYHNPRCSKSRQTLALLEEAGAKPAVIEYLKNPPDAEELRALLKKLNISAAELVRRKEAKDLGIDPDTLPEAALLEQMAANPVLVERPIVVTGKGARICRPPEVVTEIL